MEFPKEDLKDFKIIYLKITPEVIDKFYFEDPRQNFPEYWKDVAYVKDQLLHYCNGDQKEKRWDLMVFNYNHEKPFYLISDGGHRTNALRQLFKEGSIKYLDAILLPGTTANGWDNQVRRSETLIESLKKEGLPPYIIKQRHYHIHAKNYKDEYLPNVKVKGDGDYVTVIRPW